MMGHLINMHVAYEKRDKLIWLIGRYCYDQHIAVNTRSGYSLQP